jgi:hypothetical protein
MNYLAVKAYVQVLQGATREPNHNHYENGQFHFFGGTGVFTGVVKWFHKTRKAAMPAITYGLLAKTLWS